MKILITGGAGFIGSEVIRQILQTTNHSILNIDCLTYAGNLDSLQLIENNPRYDFEELNICNQEKVAKIFSKYRPDKVMHLAAESHVDRSIDNPKKFLETNIMGTFVLLSEAKSYFELINETKKKKFIFHHVSTDEVYGDLIKKDSFFREETSYNPSSPYSASKAASDHLVRAWGRTYQLPYIITNCSNNYGPYQFPEKLIPHTIISAISGSEIPIYGDGLQVRDWLYVEDHAKALIKVILDAKEFETFNIGGHNEKTNLEVVSLICEILEEFAPNKPSGILHYKDLIKFVNDRPGHDGRYAIDASKIKNALDWNPDETFETGIRKTVSWYLNNEKWWKRILSNQYCLERLGEKK